MEWTKQINFISEIILGGKNIDQKAGRNPSILNIEEDLFKMDWGRTQARNCYFY